jgi:hypothetical protein
MIDDARNHEREDLSCYLGNIQCRISAHNSAEIFFFYFPENRPREVRPFFLIGLKETALLWNRKECLSKVLVLRDGVYSLRRDSEKGMKNANIFFSMI